MHRPTAPSGYRPGLRRSVRLVRAFRKEQTEPDVFYGALAADSAEQLCTMTDLQGALLLDVGGGPGYFREAFEARGATYVALDADVGELAGRGDPDARTIIGSGTALPVADGVLDVCYSSNVLEHVDRPWVMAEEMLRATRPGGTVFLSWTVWWGPWGGHETAPWHYLGGAYARRRYARRQGREPKNRFGESLYAVTVADGLRWLERQQGGEVVAVFPRYLPRWAWWVLRIPVLREVLTWNLVIVLRRRAEKV